MDCYTVLKNSNYINYILFLDFLRVYPDAISLLSQEEGDEETCMGLLEEWEREW